MGRGVEPGAPGRRHRRRQGAPARLERPGPRGGPGGPAGVLEDALIRGRRIGSGRSSGRETKGTGDLGRAGMARTLEELNSGIDADFWQVIEQLKETFVRISTIVQGRATHTTGIAARGVARIITPIDFPDNDFLSFGKTYPIVV